MTKHMGVQRRLHRFAHLIIEVILCYESYFIHVIQPIYLVSCQHQS